MIRVEDKEDIEMQCSRLFAADLTSGENVRNNAREISSQITYVVCSIRYRGQSQTLE